MATLVFNPIFNEFFQEEKKGQGGHHSKHNIVIYLLAMPFAIKSLLIKIKKKRSFIRKDKFSLLVTNFFNLGNVINFANKKGANGRLKIH